MKEFWMVWRKGSAVLQGGQHESEIRAIAEAKKLAEANEGTYYVLRAVGYAKRSYPPVVYIECPCGEAEDA